MKEEIIASTPRTLLDLSDAFSVRSPAVWFSCCASAGRHRCFHRRFDMYTKWFSQVRTAPTTCENLRTAALQISSDIINRRGRLLKLFTKMKCWRLRRSRFRGHSGGQPAAGQESEELDTTAAVATVVTLCCPPLSQEDCSRGARRTRTYY